MRIPAIFSLLIWAVLWEIAGRLLHSDFVPPFSHVVLTIISLVQTPSFLNALGVTSQAFALGMAMALVIGIPVGVGLGLSQAANRIFNVWVNIFISAPLTALVPALMPILGIGQATVVATVFMFAVWVIIIDTDKGIRAVNPSLIAMARVNGADRRQIFFKILLPSALPEIMVGIRLGIIRGVKGVIIGQVIISLIGFGSLFQRYIQTFSMERFWALVIIVLTLAFALVEIVSMIERKFVFYAKVR